jgi:hypothetical protein
MKFDPDKTEVGDDSKSSEVEASKPLVERRLVTQVLQRLAPQSSPRANIARRTRASRLFARELSDRRRRVQGADPSGFVSARFGRRFVSGQGRGFNEEKIYQEPGRFFRNTSLKSFAQVFMSFDVKQFAQTLQILFNRIRSQQNFNASAYLNLNQRIDSFAAWRSEIHPSAPASPLIATQRSLLMQPQPMQSLPIIPSAANVHLSLALPNAAASAAQVASQVIEREMFDWRNRDRVFTLIKSETERFAQSSTNLERLVTLGQLDRQTTLRQSNQRTTLRQLERLTTLKQSEQLTILKQSDQRPTLKQKVAQLLNRTLLTAIQVRNPEPVLHQRASDSSPLIISSPSSTVELKVAAGRRPLLIPRAVSQLSLITSFGRSRDKSGKVHDSVRTSAARVFLPFALRFNPHHTEQVVATSAYERERAVLSTDRVLSERTLSLRQAVLGTVMDHSRLLVTRSLQQTRLFGIKLLDRFVTPYRTIEEVGKPLVSPELRRTQDSAPKLSPEFVYAQPARREIEEQQVVKRVETREILEMVKNEVKQSLTNVVSFRNFSGQDYEEISDRVYSSLVRRLTIERERLGLR